MLYYVAFTLMSFAFVLLGLDFFGVILGAAGVANVALLSGVLLAGTQAAWEARHQHQLHHSH